MMMLRIRKVFIYLSLITISASFASGSEISKIEFEQRAGILDWKLSSKDANVNPEDDLTDLEKPCNMKDGSAHISDPRRFAIKNGKNLATSSGSIRNVMKELGILNTKIKMNPVIAEIGKEDEPIFILFPETHLNRNNGDLHVARALDMLELTRTLELRGSKIENLSEGPPGTWKKENGLDPQSYVDRIKDANSIVARVYTTGFLLVGEVYSDKVRTDYCDSNDMFIKQMLATSAYMNLISVTPKDESWGQSLAYMKDNFPVRMSLVNINDYKAFYNGLIALPPEQIIDEASNICEARSYVMADQGYELAKKENAKVVYLSFGSVHTHGIIQQIKKHSASFIVFSPNL